MELESDQTLCPNYQFTGNIRNRRIIGKVLTVENSVRQITEFFQQKSVRGEKNGGGHLDEKARRRCN